MASSTTVWIVGTLFSVLPILPVSFAQSPTIGFISPDVVTDIGELLSKMTEKRLLKGGKYVVPILAFLKRCLILIEIGKFVVLFGYF